MKNRRGPKDRKQQLKAIMAHARGTARKNTGELQRVVVVSLPRINGPTLEEILRKYGPIDGEHLDRR